MRDFEELACLSPSRERQRVKAQAPTIEQEPLSNLEGLPKVAVPAPTIERIETADGPVWCVTYAGMSRYHSQDWQAWWLYEAARAAYAAVSGLSQDCPTTTRPLD